MVLTAALATLVAVVVALTAFATTMTVTLTVVVVAVAAGVTVPTAPRNERDRDKRRFLGEPGGRERVSLSRERMSHGRPFLSRVDAWDPAGRTPQVRRRETGCCGAAIVPDRNRLRVAAEARQAAVWPDCHKVVAAEPVAAFLTVDYPTRPRVASSAG